jgi:Tfp pilus assembly protein PilV
MNCAGFGLIDTLIALTLLAISLLGISGGVHYALRATHATLLQTQAVDLIADLTEDLHAVAPDEAPTLLSDWQARVRQTLPARDFEPPRLIRNQLDQIGSNALPWLNVEMQWKGLSGTRDGSLMLPVTSPGAGALP